MAIVSKLLDGPPKGVSEETEASSMALSKAIRTMFQRRGLEVSEKEMFSYTTRIEIEI